jgi:hypothetical protein
MATQYYMRGYNTAVPGTVGYVDWVVNDTPDSTAAFVPAPYVSAHITNITINKIVQSKINNFIKPVVEPSFISNAYSNPQDGYLFHLNSYDWLNPVPRTGSGPITIPAVSQPIGISVVRGSASSNSPFVPSPYASVFWEEGAQTWNFAYINTDGTIGTSLGLSMGTLNITNGYLAVSEGTDLVDPPALTGIIRIPNNTSINARNFANTQDLYLIGTNTSNNIVLGSDAFNAGILLTTTNGTVKIASGGSGPVISSTTVDLTLSSGTGNVNIQNNGTTVVSVLPTSLSFAAAIVNPVINQTSTGSSNGSPLTIQAQNAVSLGGNLYLNAGTGATNGSVIIEAGGINQIIVGTSNVVIGSGINYNTIITGNLIVDGYTTTIDSTTVDIVGRVVHANYSTGIAPPIYPLPFAGDLDGYITGYSVHRGSVNGTTPRDAAGLYYTEKTDLYTDGYWKFATLSQDNDLLPASIGLISTLPVLADAVIVTPNPNQETLSGTIPTVGGLRTLNNTTAVSSRTANAAQNLLLLGTDGYNNILYGNDAYNNGHIFYVNSTPQIEVIQNKFVYMQGQRRHVTNHGSSIDGSSYTIVPTDDYIAITSLTGVFTFNVPSAPTIGDTYTLKDVYGLATSHVITISGNGNDIDNNASISTGFTNINYFHIILTYMEAGMWSIG